MARRAARDGNGVAGGVYLARAAAMTFLT
jgi:hypothetical protein